jgi:hypothetical protein
MTRHTRPAQLLVFLLAAVTLLGVVVPVALAADRLPTVIKALDFLHAHQQSTGGFIDASTADSPNTTPWAILAIAAAREDAKAWNVSGKDPVDYLQSINLENAARTGEFANPPVYYAKTILAFRAAVSSPTVIFNAGTPKISLLDKLKAYRYEADGHFSPDTSGDRKLYDISSTAWALLALVAANQSLDGELVSDARGWLAAAQNDDGGWATQTESSTSTDAASTVDQTAIAIQALIAAGTSPSSSTIQRGLGYLQAAQRADAGFPSFLADVRSYAESTAWAIQAIYAADQRPTDAGWLKSGRSPVDYLIALRQPNGSFVHRAGVAGAMPVMTTAQCTIALSAKPFPFYLPDKPLKSGYLPTITSFKPGNGAVFSSTNDVRVTAEYKDNNYGTGIKTSAVRVKVDGVNKTKQAKVYSSNLSLVLADLSYGQHMIEVDVADKAGNRRTSTHTITVSYSSGSGVPPGGTPTPVPTYRPPTPSTTLYPTPTPTTTLYPTPGATPVPTTAPTTDGTVTGTPLTPGGTLGPSGSPSPSPSASSAAAAGDDGGGSGGLLGVTLLAMLPVGAGLSYWLHRRHAEALAPAGRGRLLVGGGTPWQRFKGRVPGLS